MTPQPSAAKSSQGSVEHESQKSHHLVDSWVVSAVRENLTSVQVRTGQGALDSCFGGSAVCGKARFNALLSQVPDGSIRQVPTKSRSFTGGIGEEAACVEQSCESYEWTLSVGGVTAAVDLDVIPGDSGLLLGGEFGKVFQLDYDFSRCRVMQCGVDLCNAVGYIVA